jgi:hypothetical protein
MSLTRRKRRGGVLLASRFGACEPTSARWWLAGPRPERGVAAARGGDTQWAAGPSDAPIDAEVTTASVLVEADYQSDGGRCRLRPVRGYCPVAFECLGAGVECNHRRLGRHRPRGHAGRHPGSSTYVVFFSEGQTRCSGSHHRA